MKERRKDVPKIDKITWYYRHWKDHADPADARSGLRAKDKLPSSFITDAEWNDWMLDDPRNPVSKRAKEAKELEKQKAKE